MRRWRKCCRYRKLEECAEYKGNGGLAGPGRAAKNQESQQSELGSGCVPPSHFQVTGLRQSQFGFWKIRWNLCSHCLGKGMPLEGFERNFHPDANLCVSRVLLLAGTSFPFCISIMKILKSSVQKRSEGFNFLRPKDLERFEAESERQFQQAPTRLKQDFSSLTVLRHRELLWAFGAM